MNTEPQTKLTYTNPRTHVVINDWPSGRNRVTATFEVETTAKGQRAVRTTTGKPKKLTYADKVRFADGSDGKLYIITTTIGYNMVVVMKGTIDFQHEVIHLSSEPERYSKVMELFVL